MSPYYSSLPTSGAYDAVQDKLDGNGCVLVDGGVATELARARGSTTGARREPWGLWALYSAPKDVLDVHRRYVAAGCDVLSTNSWAILDEAQEWKGSAPLEWEKAADSALRLARQASSETPREPAVAFCINGDLQGSRALGALELLTWRWREAAPDLVIFETLTRLPGKTMFEAVGMVAELGLPVWVSLRRGAEGMASVDGDIVLDRDPLRLTRAIRGLERSGASALLVNCVPCALIPGALSDLGAATSLPRGCLPNLGHPDGRHWCHDHGVEPDEFANDSLEWIECGARIVGGCCGTRPEHIAAVDAVRDRALAWSARGV